MNALVIAPQAGVSTNIQHFRASTDAAEMCKAIVVATSRKIGDRNYVPVEGWQAIAMAHGCTASACDVEKVDGGFRATGQVRRMSDGFVIAEAEGFVGEDEEVWFGGTVTDRWGKTKTHLPRKTYGIRAMAQTRAISRACRSAFAHVVVMMDAGLSTTPAEEVPEGGFQDNHQHSDAPQPQHGGDTSGPRPNRDAAIQRMRDDDDERNPDNFVVSEAMLKVEASMQAAKNKAGLDMAWLDNKKLRFRIRRAAPDLHDLLVEKFAAFAKALLPPLDPPASQQTINVAASVPSPQHGEVLDDDVPF